jgi:hypothetical protein
MRRLSGAVSDQVGELAQQLQCVESMQSVAGLWTEMVELRQVNRTMAKELEQQEELRAEIERLRRSNQRLHQDGERFMQLTRDSLRLLHEGT